jgi:hypothetical protein
LDRRKDEECQVFVRRVVNSRIFKLIMIGTISLNAVFMVLWTDYDIRYRLFRVFEVSRKSGPISKVCFVSENVYDLESKMLSGNASNKIFEEIFHKKTSKDL